MPCQVAGMENRVHFNQSINQIIKYNVIIIFVIIILYHLPYLEQGEEEVMDRVVGSRTCERVIDNMDLTARHVKARGQEGEGRPWGQRWLCDMKGPYLL